MVVSHALNNIQNKSSHKLKKVTMRQASLYINDYGIDIGIDDDNDDDDTYLLDIV